MKKHLYNSKFSKFAWFANRFGASEMILKPLRVIFAPVIIPMLPQNTFIFDGRELTCFYHQYNVTWATERCVEIPIARTYLNSRGNLASLEVGNVLSHYGPVAHAVLDKFEKGAGVINKDIIDFKPEKRFDLIISISTFEHIGYDDSPEGSSSQKILFALQNTRKLLQAGGKLVISIPVGYNPELDSLIENRQLGSFRELFLSRTGSIEWKQTDKNEAMKRKYRSRFPYANAIMVAEFGPLNE